MEKNLISLKLLKIRFGIISSKISNVFTKTYRFKRLDIFIQTQSDLLNLNKINLVLKLQADQIQNW